MLLKNIPLDDHRREYLAIMIAKGDTAEASRRIRKLELTNWQSEPEVLARVETLERDGALLALAMIELAVRLRAIVGIASVGTSARQ